RLRETGLIARSHRVLAHVIVPVPRLLYWSARGNAEEEPRAGDVGVSKMSGERGLRSMWSALVQGRRLRLALLVSTSFVGAAMEAATLLLLARIAFALANPNKDVSASIGPLMSFNADVTTLIVLAGVLVVVRFLLQLVTVRIQATLYGEVL